METLALIGVVGLVIAGLIWWAIRSAKSAGKAEARNESLEDTVDLARKQEAATADRPRTGKDLDERLRRGGL